MNKSKPWKTDRLKSSFYSAENLLRFVGIDYSAYYPTGMFRIDVGQPTDIQYLCTTGKWGFFRDGVGKNRYPKSHECETTLKRFYENVLCEYISDLPEWKEVREAVKGARA